MPWDPKQPGSTSQADNQYAATSDQLALLTRVTPAVTLQKDMSALETFQAGHGWTVVSGTATITDDTTDFRVGSQSLRINTKGDAAVSVIQKTLSTAVDLSGRFFRIAGKIDPGALSGKFTSFKFAVSSDGFATTRAEVELLIGFGGTYWVQNGSPQQTTWQREHFTAAAGTVNWAAINALRFSVQDKTVSVINLDGIFTHPRKTKGIISLVMSRSDSTQWNIARPILASRGLPATLCVDCDKVAASATNSLTTDQLRDMQNIYGHEIQGYTTSQSITGKATADITPADVNFEAAGMRSFLRSQGLGTGDDIAGRTNLLDGTDPAVYAQIRKEFRLTRATGGGMPTETFPPGDMNRVRSFLYNGNSAASIITKFQQAADAGLWFILLMHNFGTTTSGLRMSNTTLQTLVDDLATKSASGILQVRTLRSVIESIDTL